MKKLVVLLLSVGLLVGCSVQQNGPELVEVNKKDLYELTYEWAMYREIAIIAYTKLHNVSKEEATEHIETCVKEAKEKQFISWYENREKWEKK